MTQIPEEAIRLSQDGMETWRRFGQWLSDRFDDVRVTSVGHFAIPPNSRRQAFMVGVDDSPFGVVADLHSPFLVHVPGTPEMIEVVAMNTGLAPLGSVRLVSEDQTGSLYSLELRHQLHATMLTKEWLFFFADLLPQISGDLVATLQPAFGGTRVSDASR